MSIYWINIGLKICHNLVLLSISVLHAREAIILWSLLMYMLRAGEERTRSNIPTFRPHRRLAEDILGERVFRIEVFVASLAVDVQDLVMTHCRPLQLYLQRGVVSRRRSKLYAWCGDWRRILYPKDSPLTQLSCGLDSILCDLVAVSL